MIDEEALIEASEFFDALWYVNRYPDVGLTGMRPAEHYIFIGAQLGRAPSEKFDTRFYSKSYPDVIAAGINPLVHFLQHGLPEGRLPRPAAVKVERAPKAEDTSNTVVLISGEALDRAGVFYRVKRAAAALDTLGFRTHILTVEEAKRNIDLISSSRFVYIWRALFSAASQIYTTARQANIPIIFDIDDLMVRPELATAETIDAIRFNNLSEEKVRSHYSDVATAMTAADFCTASTHELAWHMRLTHRRRPTMVIPNGYDRDVYVRSRLAARSKTDDGLIRIGYASGSRTHQADFKLCVRAVANTLKSNSNARLVLFRRNDLVTLDVEEFPEMRGLDHQIEWRSFVSLTNLPSEIGRFDINLAPLEVGNPFCESKSELKVFEAALCDVPTIASPTGPFKRAMIDGETGLLAQNEDEWNHALQILISDSDARKKMGQKAHRFAMWHWGPTRRAEVFNRLIAQLKPGREASYAAHRESSERPSSSLNIRPHRILANYDRLRPSQATVIIPLYNYEDYVVEALTSVWSQSMTELDLIIVDDASTDKSLQVVTKWAQTHHERFNRLIIVQHLSNEGLGASRNTGFDLADTLYVLPLDADNRLAPRCCSALFTRIASEAATFAYPSLQQFGDSSSIIGASTYLPAKLVPGNYIDAMAMISKEAWSYVGGYSEKRRGWQDFEFWCRLRDRGLHGVHVDEVLAEYRVHQKSMLRTSTDMSRNKLDLVEDLENTYPWLSLIDERVGHHIPPSGGSAP